MLKHISSLYFVYCNNWYLQDSFLLYCQSWETRIFCNRKSSLLWM